MTCGSPAAATTHADDLARAFYVDALLQLSGANIPFLVGGAFAFAHHTGIERDTKDLDVHLRPQDVSRALGLFTSLGYRVDFPYPHWLAKVHHGSHFIDLLFSSGNGVARVDNRWFDRTVEHEVLGVTVRLCPPEEMIWSKAFVQERERFDGADVLHLIRRFGASLDWERVLDRFGEYWRVLFSHIVLFGFVYPNQRHQIPTWVVDKLTRRFVAEQPEPKNYVCYGTLLSREQYLYDITDLNYADARIPPVGRMTPHDIEIWQAAIGER